MEAIPPRKIKTGGDPRTLPEYISLRDELSKLTHPARPDVNWHYVEKRCLSLYEQNGVELQTAAWYTLARMHRAGLVGLNEGLAILEALICHQWGGFWPQSVHARMEILSSLSHRLQQQMRSLSLTYSDLGQLYRAEQLFANLGAVLQRLELKHLSQLDTLRNLMHNSAAQLENSDEIMRAGPTTQPGATVMNNTAAFDSPVERAVKWVYVAQPEPQPNVEVQVTMRTVQKKWKSFIAGMGSMLVVGATIVWGWQYFQRPDPLQAQLVASLTPLPVMLTSTQLEALRQQTLPPQDFIAQTQQQIAQLDKLSSSWTIDYSRQLLEQAQILWPEQATPLARQWQQQINLTALSNDTLNGWHEGMCKLQALTTQLNALDGQKGKYMTVSELKSQVFAAIQALSKTVPVEEQLRQISLWKNPEMVPLAQKVQAEQHLKQLITHYSTVTESQSISLSQ